MLEMCKNIPTVVIFNREMHVAGVIDQLYLCIF